MATVALRSSAGRWTMAAASLASSMAFIDSTALNVVLPSLQRGLKATGADLFWVLNAYLLMLAALILIGGALGDRLGRKKVFMTGILIFMAGSMACGLSPDTIVLIGCRIVQGAGGALMIPGSLALISSGIDEKERGATIGLWSAITTVVTIGGPILGGALADAGLWRYIFFINIPLGVLSLIILWRKVAESRNEDEDRGPDYPGAMMIASALALLTFGCLRIPVAGFGHWSVKLSLTAGVVLFAGFIRTEKLRPNPMMSLDLFSSRTFTGANALTLFLYAGLGAGMLFLSLNLVQIQGYSQLESGMIFLPFTLLMILLSRYAGRLCDRHGPRWLLIGGPATAGIGLYLLSVVGQTGSPSEYWTSFFPGIVVLGLGMSFTVAPLTATVMGAVDSKFSGTASGVNNAMSRIASVFANAIFGALAVVLFSGSMEKRVASMPLSEQERQAIMSESVNLGNARVPDRVETAARPEVIKAYHHAFIAAYATVLRIAGALGLAGALMAFVFIKSGPLH